jgi:uncharacterized protein (TIGR03067 family)
MKKVLVGVVIVMAAIVVFFLVQKWMGDDYDGLGGEPWVVLGIEAEGRKVPAAGFEGMSVQFGKGTVTWTVPTRQGLQELQPGVVRVDASKNPKEIDLEMPGDNETAPGIYRIKDDTLQICIGDRRPKEFSSMGKAQMLWTFKRK